MIKTYQRQDNGKYNGDYAGSMQEVNSSITKSLTAITDIERKSEY